MSLQTMDNYFSLDDGQNSVVLSQSVSISSHETSFYDSIYGGSPVCPGEKHHNSCKDNIQQDAMKTNAEAEDRAADGKGDDKVTHCSEASLTPLHDHPIGSLDETMRSSTPASRGPVAQHVLFSDEVEGISQGSGEAPAKCAGSHFVAGSQLGLAADNVNADTVTTAHTLDKGIVAPARCSKDCQEDNDDIQHVKVDGISLYSTPAAVRDKSPTKRLAVENSTISVNGCSTSACFSPVEVVERGSGEHQEASRTVSNLRRVSNEDQKQGNAINTDVLSNDNKREDSLIDLFETCTSSDEGSLHVLASRCVSEDIFALQAVRRRQQREKAQMVGQQQNRVKDSGGSLGDGGGGLGEDHEGVVDSFCGKPPLFFCPLPTGGETNLQRCSVDALGSRQGSVCTQFRGRNISPRKAQPHRPSSDGGLRSAKSDDDLLSKRAEIWRNGFIDAPPPTSPTARQGSGLMNFPRQTSCAAASQAAQSSSSSLRFSSNASQEAMQDRRMPPNHPFNISGTMGNSFAAGNASRHSSSPNLSAPRTPAVAVPSSHSPSCSAASQASPRFFALAYNQGPGKPIGTPSFRSYAEHFGIDVDLNYIRMSAVESDGRVYGAIGSIVILVAFLTALFMWC